MSLPNPSLPGIRQPLLDGALASRPYYLFFQWAATNVAAVAEQVDDLTAQVEALSGSGISPDANVTGHYSILTQGALTGGIVQVSLEGDVLNPGNTQYYGSDDTGTKGWFNVSDAVEVTDNLTKTVADTGVSTFDLADMEDSGDGTLLAITRDGKGRITGIRAATITGTPDQIDVANGDASSGLPTISLDPVVLAQIEAWAQLQADFLISSNGAPLVTSGGDFITTSAA